MSEKSPILGEKQWERIEPRLGGAKRPAKGRAGRFPDRGCFEGLLWILLNDGAGRAMPKQCAPAQACWRRLGGWLRNDAWDSAFGEFVRQLEGPERARWTESFLHASFRLAADGAAFSGNRRAATEARWRWRSAKVFQREAKRAKAPAHPRSGSPKPDALIAA